MTTSEAQRHGSLWLSVWLRPRATIDQVLGTYSTAPILLLAGLNAALGTIAMMVTRGHPDLGRHDWRVLVAVVLGAGVFGIAMLYVTGFFFKISGRIFRGPATGRELRAVIAWGGAPNVMGVAVALACFAGLSFVMARSPGPQLSDLALQLISGVVGLWSLVVLLIMLSRVQGFGFWRTVLSFALGYAFLLIPLLLRTFMFEPFDAPSGSMAPTIVVGDYFFVSKYSYGFSRYSLPLSQPAFAGRILGNEPERGDVVVYRQAKNPSVDFVKRLVGLPGDTIQVKEGVLYINGQAVPRELLGEYADKETMLKTKRWREALPDGRSYEVLDSGNSRFPGIDNTNVYTVPAGRYFVLGDNRENSADSRFTEAQGGGMVPYENLIGRVQMIFYSRDAARIGMFVR